MKEKLNDYKNKDLKKEDCIYYLMFNSIYMFNNCATDKEVIEISLASWEAYRKDQNFYSICKFSDFLADNYYKGNLSLEEISDSNPYDVILASENDNVNYLKGEKDYAFSY